MFVGHPGSGQNLSGKKHRRKGSVLFYTPLLGLFIDACFTAIQFKDYWVTKVASGNRRSRRLPASILSRSV